MDQAKFLLNDKILFYLFDHLYPLFVSDENWDSFWLMYGWDCWAANAKVILTIIHVKIKVDS